MTDEWGPWIEHDGKGCPCVGRVVMVAAIRNLLGEVWEQGPAIAQGGQSWFWAVTGLPPNDTQQIIRYRIRKPRGLTILEGVLENLPEREGVE